MTSHKIHFSYEPGKEYIKEFVSGFIKKLGQTAFEEAKYIVTIGGDGSLLHAFRKAVNGQKMFGMLPIKTESRGFWVNSGIETPDDLIKALETAESFKISPVKAEIYSRDGSSRIVRAFNEASVNENSGQAMKINLTVKGVRSTIGPIEIMGDGLIVSTAFGSSAVNETYGGPVMDIRNTGIILTGKGIYKPTRGFTPIVADDKSQFDIEFLEPKKRPVRLLYDGFFTDYDLKNPFKLVSINKDTKNPVEFLLTEDPSTRAFSAMIS